ncbi:unnamed protein product [Pieris macdunnoughi]|uniref:AB hydrolase-1 domain-containing protein n=1 Tax=Pieris macdunnoughi TaxID=345717 RepID=A0A821RXU9_9NEOP|nr:unnamed protein product [Pieris macdunnoughi]
MKKKDITRRVHSGYAGWVQIKNIQDTRKWLHNFSNARPAKSTDDWLTSGVKSGLGYLLAEQGYDVWMGNARGNKYSRSNVRKSPSEKDFWDFSFHEIGVIYLPTMIDFILKKTNKSSLIYIGHSQGTSTFFVMSSIRPEYNAKIDLMIALSPIAWMSHLKSPLLNYLKPYYATLELVATSLGIHEVFQDTPFLRLFQKTFCGGVLTSLLICQNALYSIGGFNYDQMNLKQLPVIFNHFSSGASTKQLWHYAQLINSGYFRQYDYRLKNVAKYGTLSPPSYPVEKITAPVAIFYGDGDWLSDVSDAKILKSYLRKLF